MRKLVIFGSAEIAELAKFYFENDSDYKVTAFTVDDAFVETESVCDLPLVPFSQVKKLFPPVDYDMFVALSYQGFNRLREEKYFQAKNAGYQLPSYVCSKSVTWPDLITGDNCFILENQTIQPTVRIGKNVMIWSGNHLGHGSFIGDHTYIASHVVISGHCSIGQRCFIGVNATVRDFSKIGNDCLIGMDASVISDLEAGSVVLGQRGEVLGPGNKRGKAIIRKFSGVAHRT